MSRCYIEINYNINHSVKDVKQIINIQNRIINGSENEYVIQFNDCKFMNPAVSVLIGTIPVYTDLIGKKVYFNFKDKDSPVFNFMKSVGMYDFFTGKNSEHSFIKQRALPFGRITNEDIMESYTDKIIELAPIIMNDKASAILSSYFYEIYQNFSHADSLIDVFSCGYWMKNELFFSIYDMGRGIPENVRKNVDANMTASNCVKWAFQQGNTTLDETIIKRGLGLSRLENFIQLNKGMMAMYTDNVCYTIDGIKKRISELDVSIKGTLFIIRIKADIEHIYIVNDGKENKNE